MAVADDLESTLDEWLASFEHADTDESVTISDDGRTA